MISAPFTANWGSPPRMRGKDFHVGDGLRFAGITPAYAGKRGGFHRQLSRVKDHPRVCGEKRLSDEAEPCKRGSPPRMRGKARTLGFSIVCLRITPAYAGKSLIRKPTKTLKARITPAYAGKSCIRVASIGRSRDHPRVCGEKSLFFIASVELKGSPPRMRGKESNARRKGQAHGITPAYAGKR